MEAFFSFMKITVITIGILVGLIVVLLAMPKSRLRGIILKIVGWGLNVFTGICVLYIVNPIDIIPDMIPILGQVDDAAAFITAIFTGFSGMLCVILGRRSLAKLSDSPQNLELEE